MLLADMTLGFKHLISSKTKTDMKRVPIKCVAISLVFLLMWIGNTNLITLRLLGFVVISSDIHLTDNHRMPTKQGAFCKAAGK